MRDDLGVAVGMRERLLRDVRAAAPAIAAGAAEADSLRQLPAEPVRAWAVACT